jgi:putative phosphoribosyl transferase
MDEARRFTDREQAGRELAAALAAYRGVEGLLILALPRGGVPVAFEVARALEAPLDLCLVRKLGVPGEEEFAFGALAGGGVRFINQEIVAALGLDEAAIEAVVRRESIELERRERLYGAGRAGRPAPSVAGRTVIIVDDGLATGATMRAAIGAVLAGQPRRIIVAVPVAARETCREFNHLDPRVTCHCLRTPPNFQAVGLWYEDFSQTTDETVIALLARAQR